MSFKNDPSVNGTRYYYDHGNIHYIMYSGDEPRVPMDSALAARFLGKLINTQKRQFVWEDPNPNFSIPQGYSLQGENAKLCMIQKNWRMKQVDQNGIEWFIQEDYYRNSLHKVPWYLTPATISMEVTPVHDARTEITNFKDIFYISVIIPWQEENSQYNEIRISKGKNGVSMSMRMGGKRDAICPEQPLGIVYGSALLVLCNEAKKIKGTDQ